MNTASNLRHLRNTKLITLQYLADSVGISKERVASYEQGRALPRLMYCFYSAIILSYHWMHSSE